MSQEENQGDESGAQKKSDGAEPFRRCYPGYCSFCRKHYREVGPLAEGPDVVLICYACIHIGARSIENDCGNRGIAMPWTIDGWWERKTAQEAEAGKAPERAQSEEIQIDRRGPTGPELGENPISRHEEGQGKSDPQEEDEREKAGPFRRCRPGYCSFCQRHGREVGPLAQGPDAVLVCYGCTQRCARLIEEECRSSGVAMPWTIQGWWNKKAVQEGDGKAALEEGESKDKETGEEGGTASQAPAL
jgi:ClpX C4-type zinc finger